MALESQLPSLLLFKWVDELLTNPPSTAYCLLPRQLSLRMLPAVEEDITINKPLTNTRAHTAHTHTHTHTLSGNDREKGWSVFNGAAVVAPFAHTLADAHTHTHTHTHTLTHREWERERDTHTHTHTHIYTHAQRMRERDTDTHTHRNHPWTHPWEKDQSRGGAELAAHTHTATHTHSYTHTHTHTHTHTARLSRHWSASLHPTAGVSEGSAAVLCSRGLETLEWAIFFSLLTSIFGLDIGGPQPPSFFHCFPTYWFPVCSARTVWALVPTLQIQTAIRPHSSERQYDTTETTRICAISWWGRTHKLCLRCRAQGQQPSAQPAMYSGHG